jgi:hypothetical protein
VSSLLQTPRRSPSTKRPQTVVFISQTKYSPLALWHLLSLDAPTVAALWTWFIARTIHLRLPVASTLAMAVAVWMLYASDRLMDARLLDAQPIHHDTLEVRHRFHHRHRTAFLTGILIASGGLGFLLPRLEPSSIHLYLILGGLVFGYFILIHVTSSAEAQQKFAHRMPKEIAVGIFFAAATFIPTVARQPQLRLALLPPALLFATLCSLNCLFIYAWEHPTSNTLHPAHATTRVALNHLPLIATTIALAGVALALLDHHTLWPIPVATAIAAILLLALHRRHRHIQPTTLRAAADLALLTPTLLLPFLHL